VADHPKTCQHPLKQISQVPLPDSVGIELERSRFALESALSGDAFDALTESIVELRMMGADEALLGSIVQRLAALAPRLTGPGGLNAWLTAVREVAQEARHCTLALLQSSEEVLRHGSPAELLMWARLGLRHGQVKHAPGDRHDAALAHFELRSRGSAQIADSIGERADLVSSKARLAALLRALFNVAPALLPVEQGLATRRPFISNLGLHLPEAGRALRGAQARRWYDAAALHAAAHLQHSMQKHERGSLKPIQMALLGVLEDARVEALAVHAMPGLRRLWGSFHIAEPAHGNTFVVLMPRLARALLDREYDDPHPWVVKAQRLFLEATDGGRDPKRLAPVTLREMASLLGNDIGQMRLQFNYRDYVVEPAYRDDNAWLWLPPDDAQAQIQPVADEAPQPPDTDADLDPRADDSDGKASPGPRPMAGGDRSNEQSALAKWQYPEWDRLVGDYRSAWCTVVEERPPLADPQPLQQVIDRHRTLLLRLKRVLRAGRLRERVWLRAQPHGDALDLDAAVRSAIDRRSCHPPGQKVYQRTARRERDVAALVLLDGSVSTADPVPSHTGCSVLDLAREAALLTTLTLTQAGDRCAIDAFCSNGRHEVRYSHALGFDEALDDAALARLAGVTSRWSTRMGAALRHATQRLALQVRHKRLLLFVTDGEPHDIDIHDRRYLIEDARRAVLEAGRCGVTVFCVTLDPAADAYVRGIFGSTNVRVLDRIESLPRILPAMVLRLTR